MKRIILLIISMVLIAGCTGSEIASTGSSDQKSAAATQAKESFTNENFSKLATDPDKYKGSPITLTGKIFMDVEESEKQTGFQMWTNPAKSEGNVVVVYDGTGLKLKSDDFVKVTGKVEGALEGENMMGAKITAPRIFASKIEKVSAADVLAPTENTVQVNQTQTQHGVAITVEKIEFAKNETRLFLKVKNGSKAKASFYSFNAKLTQASSQFEPQDNYEANYPEVQSEILPGIETSGVIAFGAVDYTAKNFKVFLEASSDSWDLDFKPFVFDLAW